MKWSLLERKHSPGQLPPEVRGQREATGGSLFYLEEGGEGQDRKQQYVEL